MNKRILLIDMDGVICEWYTEVYRRYTFLYPLRPAVPPDQLDHFYLQDSYHTDVVDDVLHCSRSAGLFENLEPVPGALDALRDIEACTDNIEPYLCTSPDIEYEGQMCYTEKARWVEKHLGRFWLNRLILTKDKTLVRGHILIDDKPDITGAMKPTWQQLLYDRSWNQDSDLPRFVWGDWRNLKESLMGLQLQ